MADYTITAANVDAPSASATTGIAGEAITAGMPVYVKSTDSLIYKAQSDGTSEEATVAGIAVCDAAAGQVVAYTSGGSVTYGSIFSAAGAVVCLSNTAGAICPVADVSSSEYLSILGWSTSASVLKLNIINTGVELA